MDYQIGPAAIGSRYKSTGIAREKLFFGFRSSKVPGFEIQRLDAVTVTAGGSDLPAVRTTEERLA
jgi:hypothetical protein